MKVEFNAIMCVVRQCLKVKDERNSILELRLWTRVFFGALGVLKFMIEGGLKKHPFMKLGPLEATLAGYPPH